MDKQALDKQPTDNDILLTKKVYTTIRNLILTGKLKPREKLTNAKMASLLGVSRTPVRAALDKLSLEGLVELIPRSGAYVSDIFCDDLEELYLIRSVLEGLAVRLAVPIITDAELEKYDKMMEEYKVAIEEQDLNKIIRLNAEFHLSITFACNKPRLINEIKKLYDYCLRYRLLSLVEPRKVDQSYSGHLEIIEAVKKRDPEYAEQVVKNHLSKAPAYIYEALKKYEKDNTIAGISDIFLLP